MTFTYEASWTAVGSRITWDAIIRRDGEEIGRPYGQIIFAVDTAAATHSNVASRVVMYGNDLFRNEI
jgi:mannose/fructose-specific phosphotransferase system component IIA